MRNQNFLDFEEVIEYLQSFIPKNFKKNFKADWGLKTVYNLLERVDNPQEKIPIFHIAGTSGKGSTSFLISQILKANNYKPGLHLSPYLLDFRERFIINNSLPKQGLLTRIFNEFNHKLGNFRKDLSPTYFEIITCFTYYLFAKQKLSAAVIEVGMGGKFDATNCVKNPNKICVINRTGFDHTEILGNTIQEIATQQAGIIQEKNSVILLDQEFTKATKVFKEIAKQKNSNLSEVNQNQDYKIKNETSGEFQYYSITNQEWIDIKLSLKGEFQIYNAALALRAVEVFLNRKKNKLNIEKTQDILNNICFRGRFEEVEYNDREWILDSAHNPQKIKSFISSLKKYHPDQKFSFFLAFSGNKDFNEMLDQILPISEQVVFTNFEMYTQGSNKKSLKLIEIKKYLTKERLKEYSLEGKVHFKTSPRQAFIDINKLVKKQSKNHKVVATGSIYFLSKVYELLDL
jgi:dihydrofolate synthase/folylpolyglutamate synthase